MSYSFEEVYKVYDERAVKARKEHRCDACKESIPAKHRYKRISIIFGGGVSTVKRCLRCQAIHEHLRTVDSYGELWPDEELNCGEEYLAHWGKEPPEEIAALAFVTADEMQKRSP